MSYENDGSHSEMEKLFAPRFRIQKRLGCGSFSVVYCVFDDDDKKKKALKIIKKNNITKNEYKELKKEVEIIEGCRHPNIIETYFHFKKDQMFCILSEICEHGDLETYLREREDILGFNLQLKWSTQLLSGLKYIHSQRIIHRDIKPQNIFLKEDFLKYGDFGLARQLSNTLSEPDTKCGTPSYIAPELSDYNPSKGETYTPKIDVWSLGCTLFEIITLRKAFEGNTLNEIFKKIVSEEIPTISESHLLSNLLKKWVNLKESQAKLYQSIEQILLEGWNSLRTFPNKFFER